MNYLFDTSTIMNLIQSKSASALELFQGQFLIELSYYELGNILWKLKYREIISQKELQDLVN